MWTLRAGVVKLSAWEAKTHQNARRRRNRSLNRNQNLVARAKRGRFTLQAQQAIAICLLQQRRLRVVRRMSVEVEVGKIFHRVAQRAFPKRMDGLKLWVLVPEAAIVI